MIIVHLIMFGLAMVTAWDVMMFLCRKAKQWYTFGTIKPYTYSLGQLSVQYISQPNYMKVFLEGEISERFDTADQMAVCSAVQDALQNNFKRKKDDVEIH